MAVLGAPGAEPVRANGAARFRNPPDARLVVPRARRYHAGRRALPARLGHSYRVQRSAHRPTLPATLAWKLVVASMVSVARSQQTAPQLYPAWRLLIFTVSPTTSRGG